MQIDQASNFVAALAIGLLVGVERERRKGRGRGRQPAGVRTFAVVALAGAVAGLAGALALAAVVAGVSVLAAVAYARKAGRDPGLTTEIALILVTLLGALAMSDRTLAVGIGVCVAALLAVRTPLHGFINQALSADELRDALILVVATFVVWPLLPNRPMGPFNALNPHALWLVVILIMAIGGAGRLAVRLTGVRLGVPVVGFLSGFVSATATIAALGARAKANPEMLGAAVAGALLSTVATTIEMVAVLIAIDVGVARAMLWPLVFAGATGALYAANFLLRSHPFKEQARVIDRGSALNVASALLLAALLSGVLLISAALKNWFGETGLQVGAAFGGFADAHAAAASVASLAANGAIDAKFSVLPITLALTANTLTKIALVLGVGDSRYAGRVLPGLLTFVAAAWLGYFVSW